MRYTPAHYARAFIELAAEMKSAADREKLIAELLATVEKHGDQNALPKIVAEMERMERTTNGRNLWEVEFARAQKMTAEKLLAGIARRNDTIRETITPDLVAGIRITKNGESQFDASLKYRLQTLFRN